MLVINEALARASFFLTAVRGLLDALCPHHSGAFR